MKTYLPGGAKACILWRCFQLPYAYGPIFSVRQHICYSALHAIARPGRISQRWSKI